MNIALAQINPTVGGLRGNSATIKTFLARAARRGADLVVFPELSLCGYPPRDLLDQSEFIDANHSALMELAASVGRTAALVGFVQAQTVRGRRRLYNAAALLHHGRIVAIRQKTLLPTYDVFDESRHFTPATDNRPILFGGRRIGLTICEDMWNIPELWPESPYRVDPVARLARAGVDVFINMSSSPFHRGKTRLRLELVRHHAQRHRRPFLYVSQVGGNDEVLFDGHSFALNAAGAPIAQARGFNEDLLLVDPQRARPCGWKETSEIEQIRQALVMGVRDYLAKCGFREVVLGLSGGIDSAVTAALAAEALGAAHVTGVLMPSLYSSRGSVDDARALAKNLGIRTLTLPITPVFSRYLKTLRPAFRGLRPDVTEENLQARIRGTLLMAISNKKAALLLTTGNKSELSMGYCTLYGDMNGGLAVISDVPKTLVYKLGRQINARRVVIPEASFTKPPSAELRPNQTDQDSLPPYEVLDGIVEAYVEEGQSLEAIVAMGYNRDVVQRILLTIDRNEYKRRQAAPGLRISVKSFGIGRRMPIARGNYREYGGTPERQDRPNNRAARTAAIGKRLF